jgi:hypothetical protein
MATQTLSSADAILKDDYHGPVVEQLNYKTYMLDQIERDSTSVDHTGRRAIFALHTGRNRGRGGRGDAGTLPVAGLEAWQDAIIPIKYQYQSMEISDASIQASKSNAGAFVSLLEAETKGVAQALKKDMNRQIFGTGDGKLATVKATAEETKVIEVDSVQYIGVGDPVDVLVAATGEKSEGVEATTVVKRTPAESKIELAEKVKKATTSYAVYISGSRSNEINGLRNIINTGRTLHEINSATAGNEFWNSTTIKVGESATATAVAGESSFIELADEVSFNGNGEVEVFITTRGIRSALANTYQSQKRFNDAQAVNIHGGYTAIMVNEMPVIADDDAPKGFAFGINKDSFRWFQQVGGPHWLEAPQNGDVFRLKAGTTAGTNVAVWSASFAWYCNLGNVAPNRNGRLEFATDKAAK